MGGIANEMQGRNVGSRKSQEARRDEKRGSRRDFAQNGIKLENDSGYDACYVANMCKADYYKRSIADEAHLALFVKDYIDDVDAYDACRSRDSMPTASEAGIA